MPRDNQPGAYQRPAQPWQCCGTCQFARLQRGLRPKRTCSIWGVNLPSHERDRLTHIGCPSWQRDEVSAVMIQRLGGPDQDGWSDSDFNLE